MAAPDGNGSQKRGLFKRAARGASDRVLEYVDPDVVLEHIDVNALLDRIDINALLDRVDIDRLLERADIDQVMERVDIKAIVERAGIPEIVAESTSHLTGSALDLFRRPIVGLDVIVFRGLNGLLRRQPATFPSGPSDLIQWVDDRTEGETAVETGRYAGAVSRLLAFIVDGLIVTTGFTAFVAAATFLVSLVLGDQFDPGLDRGLWYLVAFISWAFLYLWLAVAIFGKTLGKALLGLRVVGSDGSLMLHKSQSLVRALTYSLSFIPFGIGLLGVIFGRQRRAWHDNFAGTAVVYDWGSRAARMPVPLADFLERRQRDG
jgi:uncharacterized RDD family membrane protein YckC